MFSPLSAFILLLAAVSVDAFTAGLSYGINKVKIPFGSALVMALLSGFFLFLALVAGDFINPLLPPNTVKHVSFGVLLVLGLYRLFDTLLPKTIKNVNKDDLTVLSPKEAFFLGLVLSLDNIAAGFGFQPEPFTPLLIFLAAAVAHFLIVYLGCLAGQKIAAHTTLNLSFVGALLLLLLAVTRLLAQ